ncbi:hypothetical protein KR018_011820, partial [Drosophila ironensis]
MGFHVGRQLLLAGFVLSVLALAPPATEAKPQDVITVAKEETEVVVKEEGNGDDDDDDSSSEETVEDSGESSRRRRDLNPDNTLSARAGIPGLPDPATIIKVAELFQSLGEQIVPILIDAILPSVEGGAAAADRLTRSAE